MSHWEKNRTMLLESTLKFLGSLTILGFSAPQGPWLSMARTHGAGGSGGFSGDRYQGGAHLLGVTGNASGCGSPVGGCGFFSSWSWFDIPALSFAAVWSK